MILECYDLRVGLVLSKKQESHCSVFNPNKKILQLIPAHSGPTISFHRFLQSFAKSEMGGSRDKVRAQDFPGNALWGFCLICKAMQDLVVNNLQEETQWLDNNPNSIFSGFFFFLRSSNLPCRILVFNEISWASKRRKYRVSIFCESEKNLYSFEIPSYSRKSNLRFSSWI